MSNKSEKIAALNDAQRRMLNGVVSWTAGVEALPHDQQAELLRRMIRFDDFNEDNDPYGEHDFGVIEMDGQRYFFKIDYYDLELTAHSPDPAESAVTQRVITVMLADEY